LPVIHPSCPHRRSSILDLAVLFARKLGHCHDLSPYLVILRSAKVGSHGGPRPCYWNQRHVPPASWSPQSSGYQSLHGAPSGFPLDRKSTRLNSSHGSIS